MRSAALACMALLAAAWAAGSGGAGPGGAGPGGAGPDEGTVRVHVRVEGLWAHVWSGEVELGPAYTLRAVNSGRVHVLDQRTPLGALAAALDRAGLDLDASDEFDDLVVFAVGDEAWWTTAWWDYRANGVETTYGPQAQWLAWAPPLRDGDEVLWYVDRGNTLPLRLDPLAGPVATPAGCAGAYLAQAPAADVQHQPGQAWPPVVWAPAPLARLHGAAESPIAGGLAVALADAPGWVWAEEHPLPGDPPVHLVRSARAWQACGG